MSRISSPESSCGSELTGVDSRLMFYVKLALILLVMLLGLALHLRNGQLIIIDFYVGNFELPLSLALGLTLFAGALLGVLAALPLWLRLQRDKTKLGKQLKALQPQAEAEAAPHTD